MREYWRQQEAEQMQLPPEEPKKAPDKARTRKNVLLRKAMKRVADKLAKQDKSNGAFE